jgi:CubicO group peptidase (beta-lactamase class C family)
MNILKSNILLTLTLLISATLLAQQAHSAEREIRVTKAERVGMSSERLTRIGRGMRRLIDADKIPGTVTLVARRGEVVHYEANGLRNIAAGLPMEKDTIFRL